MRIPLVTSGQMRAIDSLAVRREPAAGYSLMSRAGEALSRKVRQILGDHGSGMVAIFCGKGNNGGDGLVLARLLLGEGIPLRVFLTAAQEDLTGDALHALADFRVAGGHLETLEDVQRLEGLDHSCRLVVDALVGTGLRGSLHGLVADVVRCINGWQVPVLAVDVPSGFDSAGGVPGNPCMRTRWTLMMGFPRVEAFFYPGGDFFGSVEVADLVYPEAAVRDCHAHHYTFRQDAFARLLPPRKVWGDKKDQGVCTVFAGSRGMTGAATLCASAALRSGAGMVHLGAPTTELAVLGAKLTEAVLHALPASEEGTLADVDLRGIAGLLARSDAVCVGPGLSLHPDTQATVHALLPLLDRPVVLDADALNALRDRPELLQVIPGPVIITPHAGEWSRLFGRLPMAVEEMLNRLREVSAQYRITVVYKGNPTVVSTPDGENYVIPTGNSGMAKAGSGDVLAGIITALLAQGSSTVEAALLGVQLHTLAGRKAAQKFGEYAMLPSDVVGCLGDAFRQVQGVIDDGSPVC